MIGIQKQGRSSFPIYEAAKKFVKASEIEKGSKVADIGGGKGAFSTIIQNLGHNTTLFDFDPAPPSSEIAVRHTDLNGRWAAEDNEFDMVVALEVIEHVENPRHFFREIMRIGKPGAHCLISTPNQLSLSSKLCFSLRDQHQWFQDSGYPAHITALLEVDLFRICQESGGADPVIFYSGHGRIPGTRMTWQDFWTRLSTRRFSDNVFFSFKKAKE